MYDVQEKFLPFCRSCFLKAQGASVEQKGDRVVIYTHIDDSDSSDAEKLVTKPRNRKRKGKEENVEVLPTVRAKVVECPICYSEYMEHELYQCKAGHLFCKECLRSTFKHRAIALKAVKPCACPHDCEAEFDSVILPSVLTVAEMDAFDRMCLELLDSENINTTCPSCEGGISAEDSSGGHQCPLCKFSFCFKCRCPTHEGDTCAEAADKKALRALTEAEKTEKQKQEQEEEKYQREKALMIGHGFVKCPDCPGDERNLPWCALEVKHPTKTRHTHTHT